MATYVNLTVPAKDIIGALYDEKRTSAYIEADTPHSLIIVDGTSLRVGGRREKIGSDGTVTFANLVATNSADNPVLFQYKVTLVFTPKGGRQQETLTTSWFPLVVNKNLAAIPEAWDDITAPPSWRSEFLAGVTAITGPVDATIEAAVKNTGGVWPLSSAALSAAIAAKIAAHPAVVSLLANSLTADETAQTALLNTGTLSTALTVNLFAAPYNCRVEQFALISSTAIAVSATDYWVAQLQRGRDGVWTDIAGKSTRSATEGEAITADQAWTFDTVEFGTYSVLAAGDLLRLVLTPVGSPAALTGPSITYRAPRTDATSVANPVTLLLNTFTAANSTTTVPASEVGPVLAPLNGSVWGVTSNKAYSPTVGTGLADYLGATVTGLATTTIDLKLDRGWEINYSSGAFFLASNSTNGLATTTNALYYVLGGAAPVLIGTFISTYVNGDTMRIVPDLANNKVNFYRQFASAGPFSFNGVLTIPAPALPVLGDIVAIRFGTNPSRLAAADFLKVTR